jgi:X-X-X-Leu-X-X-Gly heptad repeat protein
VTTLLRTGLLAALIGLALSVDGCGRSGEGFLGTINGGDSGSPSDLASTRDLASSHDMTSHIDLARPVDLATGSHDLSTGSHDLSTGSHDLATGSHDLSTGSIDLATGSHDLSTSSRDLSTTPPDLATPHDLSVKPVDMRRPVDLSGPCSSSSQCPAGESCDWLSGVCVPTVGCQTDGQCPGGDACINGQCLPVQICIPLPIFPPCPTGDRCAFPPGVCVPVANCGTEGPCSAPNETCIDGYCEPNTCERNADCNDGYLCVGDRCVAPRFCGLLDPCPRPEVCQAHICVAP